MKQYFRYGKKEINYLKERDPDLAGAVDRIGPIKREREPDLLKALVRAVIAQQISTQAQKTVWSRLEGGLAEVSPEIIMNTAPETLRGFGLSRQKINSLRAAAQRIFREELNWEKLPTLEEEEFTKELTRLKGVGPWTAEMLMIFSLGRPDVLSAHDLGIRKGLCLLSGRKEISPALFQKYRTLYSPCGSVASLYLWEIAGGALSRDKNALLSPGKGP